MSSVENFAWFKISSGPVLPNIRGIIVIQSGKLVLKQPVRWNERGILNTPIITSHVLNSQWNIIRIWHILKSQRNEFFIIYSSDTTKIHGIYHLKSTRHIFFSHRRRSLRCPPWSYCWRASETKAAIFHRIQWDFNGVEMGIKWDWMRLNRIELEYHRNIMGFTGISWEFNGDTREYTTKIDQA